MIQFSESQLILLSDLLSKEIGRTMRQQNRFELETDKGYALYAQTMYHYDVQLRDLNTLKELIESKVAA
jgi:hypothetical protein